MPNPFRHVLTKSLTATQQDLLKNYIPEAEEEEKKERRKWQPLQMLLDLLSRGQYVTANVAEAASRRQRGETGEGTRLGQAAWQGLTGKRKGDWEKVLFGGQVEGGEEFGGWFPEAKAKEKPLIRWTDKSGKQKGIIRPTKWAGFAANVLLDPTTYIGLGPTKAARGAAKSYADDAVKVLRRMFQNPEELAKLVRKPAKELTEKGAKRLSAHSAESMARRMAEAYKTSRRHALRTPTKELRKGMGEDITKLISREEEGLLQKLMGMADGLTDAKATGMVADWKKSIEPLEQLQKNIPQLYGGGGERALRLFGKEVGTSVRQPWAGVRGLDRFKDWFGATEFGNTLGDAWWAVNNKGPIGELRQALGIRNPYEKMLRMQELQADVARQVSIQEGTVDVMRITADEKMLPQVQEVMRRAEEAGEGVSWDALLKNPEELAQLGIKDPEPIRKTLDAIKDYTDQMYREEMGLVKEGIIPSIKYRENYLPGLSKGGMARSRASRNIGGASPGFTKGRKYLQKERVALEEAMAAKIFRMSPDDAGRFVNEFNLSEFSTDLRQMLLYRTIGHARLMKHGSIVRQFREFGIPIAELDDLTKQYVGINRALPQLGLTKVSGEAFDGLLFDEQTAKVLERVSKATTTELPKFRRAMAGFMSWWRAVVTMSPGFHVRNHISNSITGYTIHGYKWFDLDRTADALAGTVHVLNRTNPAQALKEMGLDQRWYFKRLSNVRGGKTVQELADEAYQRGVITTATKGFDPIEGVEHLSRKRASLNPLAQDNAYFQGSHAVGNRVENAPRFKSFLIDVEDTASQGAEAMKRVMDNAGMRARRWWLDYSDLTDTERLIRDSVIPFWSWVRKNLANQISGVMMYPEVYSLYPKLQQLATIDDPEFDPMLIPDWMKDLGAFPVQRKEDGEFVFFNPNIPIQDINRIPIMFEEGNILQRRPKFAGREMIDDIVEMASPMVKNIFQQLPEKGYDVFYKRDLDYYGKAPFVMRLFTKSPKMVTFLDGAVKAMGGTGLGVRVNEQSGKMEMDAKVAKLLETNLPLLRTLDRLALTGTALIPGVEEALTAATGAGDDYEKLDSFFQWLSWYGGIKFKPVDMEEARREYGSDILRRAEEERKRVRSGQRLPYGAVSSGTRWQNQQQAYKERIGLP